MLNKIIFSVLVSIIALPGVPAFAYEVQPYDAQPASLPELLAFLPGNILNLLNNNNNQSNTSSGGVIVYQTQSKRDYYDKVGPDQRANGGVDETAAHGCPQYQTNQVSPTGQRICYLYDPTAFPTTWSLGGFNSPGNNRMAAWDPATNKWFTRSANSFCNSRYNYITCKTLAKADASLTSGGASEVTINRGESVPLTWYSQYGSIRKATCTATNFDTNVTTPASTITVPRNNCGGPFGRDNFFSFIDATDSGIGCGTTFSQTTIPASTTNQPFSGTKTVSPTQTTTYTYTCVNGNGTNSASVTVNVIQPEQEPIAVSCSPSVSSGVIDEPITWSTTVTGHSGPFSYQWTGSDGLSGSTASVVKRYSNVGTKTARVTVSFGPGTPSSPVTPSTPTASCLPDNAEVPAGYLCSRGGMERLQWGQCCSGEALLRCPAPNEPAEAFCAGRVPGGVTPTPSTGTGSGVYEFVMTRDLNSDPSLWADVAVRCVPSSTCNFECNAATVGRTCRSYYCPADNFRSSEVFRCQEVPSTPPPPTVTTPGEQGFSITTDCNGTICTNRSCTVEGGNPGVGDPPQTGNPGVPGVGTPTWGVTINIPGQCTVGPMCVGASVYNQALDCSRELVRACPFGCISGQCVAPQPEIDLSITPAGVRRGESCSIQVAARHVSSCTISGTGISQTLSVDANGMVPSQTLRTPGIENTATYTVSCQSPRGPTSKSAQCVFLPIFREE